jgi:isochorismate hydrolase
MYQNLQQSRIIILLKRIQPYFVRIFNSIVYFIISVIKSIFRGAMDQFKGKM